MIKPTNFTSFILAAGDGKRMSSKRAKPLHAVGGKPMLSWVIETAVTAGSDQLVVVTSPSHNQIEDYLAQNHQTIASIKQEKALGTGHAALTAYKQSDAPDQPILVLFGDTPLITAETCQRLADSIISGADLCVLGFETAASHGYGRLKTDADGALLAIIEEADATEADKQITKVNAGVMAFSKKIAAEYLAKIANDNAQGEYYLTDLVSLCVSDGLQVDYLLGQADEVQGVNCRADLSLVEASLQDRLRQSAMAKGATLIAPETVFLSADTIIEPDVIIEPHVLIMGGCHIQSGAHIKAFSHLEGAIVGQEAIIGPYARLREGSNIGRAAKIGNFVETKKTTFADGAKANHLSYIGDAVVGAKANIGAGTITCNYDGYDKFKTEIGKGAFIGSNTALVAPLTIGDGAIIGAGSTITKSVQENDIALTRAAQKDLRKGADKFRARKSK